MGLKKREQGSRDAAQALEQQLRQAQSEAEAAAQARAAGQQRPHCSAAGAQTEAEPVSLLRRPGPSPLVGMVKPL